MSNNKVEKKECQKCLHYEMCLDNFRKAKEEGLWELTDEKEYFAHADECDFCAVGYCKQSEWISVEERLPEADTDVLVITCHGSFKVARCNIYHNGTLVLWMTNDGLGEKAITHWMPLPEPPKGGE